MKCIIDEEIEEREIGRANKKARRYMLQTEIITREQGKLWMWQNASTVGDHGI